MPERKNAPPPLTKGTLPVPTTREPVMSAVNHIAGTVTRKVPASAATVSLRVPMRKDGSGSSW